MTTRISAAAKAAQDAARHTNGQFGEQQLAEPGQLDLSTDAQHALDDLADWLGQRTWCRNANLDADAWARADDASWDVLDKLVTNWRDQPSAGQIAADYDTWLGQRDQLRRRGGNPAEWQQLQDEADQLLYRFAVTLDVKLDSGPRCGQCGEPVTGTFWLCTDCAWDIDTRRELDGYGLAETHDDLAVWLSHRDWLANQGRNLDLDPDAHAGAGAILGTLGAALPGWQIGSPADTYRDWCEEWPDGEPKRADRVREYNRQAAAVLMRYQERLGISADLAPVCQSTGWSINTETRCGQCDTCRLRG